MKITVLNRKSLTIIGLVLLLVIAALINLKLSGKKEVVNQESDTEPKSSQVEIQTSTQIQGTNITKLIQYEAERKIERQKELQYLDDIISDKNTDQNTRDLANNQKLLVLSNISIEQVISEILVGKGFNEVTVVCGQESVNVLVEGVDLDDSKVAQILDIAVREANCTPENVKIIPLD